MQDIICNMITWVVIIVVMSTLSNNVLVLGKRDGYKADKMSLNSGYYIIEYSKPLKIIISVGFLFFLAIFIVNVITYLGICVLGTGIDAGTVIFFGLFVLLCTATFSGVVIWRIVIDGNEIIYRNYIGRTRRYTFEEISEIKELKNHKLIAYSNGKRIFSIDNNLPMGAYLKCIAREKGVLIKYK